MWSVWKIATAGLEPGGRLGATAAAVLLAACAGSAPEPPLTPQTVTPEPPPTAAPPPPPAAPAPPAAPTVITIEEAAPAAAGEPTLAEAAARERRRRAASDQPAIVITDKNLKDHATGQLTFLDAGPAEEGAAEAPGETAEAAGETDGRGEAYWRQRVRELRQRWKDATERGPEMQGRAAELRRQFYAADDPYYRDTRIKPAWDRVLDLIGEAEAEAEAWRQELVATLDEGRRAGALPGWLRDGIELEPEPLEPPTDEHVPGEPEIYQEDDGAGR